MKYEANSVDDYVSQLPEERKAPINKLRKIIKENLPNGFEETMNYGMIGYVVPHSKYPNGYHCDPQLPLPFMNIASQKNSINIYHMGMYAKKELLDWFVTAYPNHVKRKLDMGKSCVRFKKIDEIPFDLIGELATKMSPENWIDVYESVTKK